MRGFIPRFLGALLYLIGLTLVGVLGYTLIEGWRIHDALYMSVITIFRMSAFLLLVSAKSTVPQTTFLTTPLAI